MINIKIAKILFSFIFILFLILIKISKKITILIKTNRKQTLNISIHHQKNLIGEKYNLTMKIEPSNKEEKIFWNISNTKTANLNNNYLIIKSNGKALITAYQKKNNNKSIVCLIDYNSPELSFKETNFIIIETKKSKQLNLSIKDNKKYIIKYESSHPEIININDKGNMTAIRPGNSIVTVKVKDNIDIKFKVFVSSINGFINTLLFYLVL